MIEKIEKYDNIFSSRSVEKGVLRMRSLSNLWIYVLILGGVFGVMMSITSPYLTPGQKKKIKEFSFSEKKLDDESRFVVYKNRFSVECYIGYSLFVVIVETGFFVYYHFFELVDRAGGGAVGMFVAIFAVALQFSFFLSLLLWMIVELEEVVCNNMEKYYMENYGVLLLRDKM